MFLLVLLSVAAIPELPEGTVLPLIVDGSVTIDGAKAPIGTIISAKIDDQTRTEFMVKIEGRFAFVVEGNEADEGKLVSFFVNDVKAEQITTWSSGKVEKINITIGQASDENNENTEEQPTQTDTNSGSSSGGGGGSSIKKTVVETTEEQETKAELEKDEEDSEKGLEETNEESAENDLVNEEEITLDEEEPKPFLGILTIIAILVIGLIIYFIVIKK